MAQGGGGLMVSVSGIRGRVGDALSPEVVARYAAAFGAWSLAQGGSRRIVVGRDSRVSGPMVHRIVAFRGERPVQGSRDAQACFVHAALPAGRNSSGEPSANAWATPA